MAGKKRINITLKWMASVLILAAGAYASYVGVAWLRYAKADGCAYCSPACHTS